MRTLLNRFFGLRSFSLYDDTTDIAADPELAKLVGHVSHGMHPRDFIELARREDHRFFVKTHGKPHSDDEKAIYMVRDGRAALVSYFHYNRDILKVGVSLPQVVSGQAWAGDWSENVNAWVFSDRPNTLVLKFEDLVTNQPETLQRIADFIERPIRGGSNIDFSELHGVAPTFFRKGSNTSNATELDVACPDLFWSRHGETMVRLGYVPSIPGA